MKTSEPLRDTPLSRRQWIRSGLTVCGSLALGGLALAADAPVPAGYTQPAPVTDLSLAPGMQSRVITWHHGFEKSYAVIFGKGDEVLSGLTAFAIRERITGGSFTAIGSFQKAKFGWFDSSCNAFRDIPIDQQVELVSFAGDVGLVNNRPVVHAHAAVAFPDGSVHGGHVLNAFVWPTMELFFTAYSTKLVKKLDKQTQLYLFDLKA